MGGNMSRRFGLLCAIAIATLLPATGLFSQENLPNTLQQLQETLKRLQNEVKELQSTVQRLMKEAKNNKGAAAAAPGTAASVTAPSTAASAAPGIWRNAQEAYQHGKQLEDQKQYQAAIEAYGRAI